MFTEEDLALRRAGIGSSEIAAVVGLSPWATALDVYARKLGFEEEFADSEFMRWGRLLEPVIADRYAQELGVELVTSQTVRHVEYEWMVATPDRLYADGSRLVEIKNVSAPRGYEWGESGTSRVPERYYLQVLWQMIVTGVHAADLAALVGGHDLRVYEIPYDPELAAYLVEVGREFWFDHVVARVPPEIDDMEAAGRYLAVRYPRDSGETVEADWEIDVWIDRLREAREVLAEAEAAKLEAECRIKEFMGEASTLVSRNGRVTYKSTKDIVVVDWKAAALEGQVPRDVIAAHTRIRPGGRRFVPRFAAV
jgi:putative phage-type endonuclease